MLQSKVQLAEKAQGLGIEIKGLEDIPFIVQGRPLFDFGGVDPEVLSQLGQDDEDLFLGSGLHNIAVFPDGRVEGLKTVSNQYQVVQHVDAVLQVLESLPEEFDLQGVEIMASPNGGKVFAKFKSGHEIEIKPGDSIQYQLLLENSADTTTRFSLSGGAWRFICSNGMKIPDSRVEQIAKKKLHKSNLSLADEIGEFLGIMEQSISSMSVWKTYTRKKLGAPELESVFEILEAGPRVQEEILDTELRGENASPRYLLDQRKLTAWDLYNGFSQRITDSESPEGVKIENGGRISKAFDKILAN